MISKKFIIYLLLILSILTISCGDKEDQEDSTYYTEWTSVGDGLSANVTKNVLTEFVGSTKCPYCPATDSLLLSYFNSGHENYVGSTITNKWFLVNYHTYSPSRGDPMYEFLRRDENENDYCAPQHTLEFSLLMVFLFGSALNFRDRCQNYTLR